MNSTILILSIVVSVLSIVWIVLSYFGIVRYYCIKYKSFESYVRAYEKLPRANYEGKIIVSLGGDENTDLEKIKPTLKSVLDQTVHVDQIALNLPDSKNWDIPDYIKNTDVISVYKVPIKCGKASAILGPLLREKNGSTVIICLDTNVIYGPDLIELFLEKSKEHPKSAIFTTGYNAKNKINNKQTISSNTIDVLQCEGGVLIKPSFLPVDIIETNHGPSDMLQSQDIWLSANLAKNHCPFTKMDYSENKKRYNKDNNKEIDKKNINYFAAYLISMN